MTKQPVATARQQHFQQVFADITRSGVYHLPATKASKAHVAAKALNYAVFQVDLAAVRSKKALLVKLAHSMNFPDEFGHNWDALADVLGDPEWQSAAGWLVMLQHAERIQQNSPEDFLVALDIFAAAADEWRNRGKACWCLIDVSAEGITELPQA